MEQWKDVVGYEGLYKVSDRGRVCTLKGRKKQLLSPATHYKGHLQLYLYGKTEKPKKFFVHRLVAAAFLAPVEGKDLVNHIDSNKKNNLVSNLEYMTVGENTRHYHDWQKCIAKGCGSKRRNTRNWLQERLQKFDKTIRMQIAHHNAFSVPELIENLSAIVEEAKLRLENPKYPSSEK